MIQPIIDNINSYLDIKITTDNYTISIFTLQDLKG